MTKRHDFTITLGDRFKLDARKLWTTNALIVGNSGSGKTLAARQLIEQVIECKQPHFAVVVFDLGGEFWTLRERYDILIVGKGGELPADPRIAGELARFVRQTGCRVVINLSDQEEETQQEFAHTFVSTLLKLPDTLWKIPLLAFVAEAHLLAPEVGNPVSKKAIRNLSTLGRKQNICTVAETQRLPQVFKSFIGSLNNRMFGRVVDQNDLAAASRELGFEGRSQWPTMQAFKPGEFFAKGPAFGFDKAVRGRTNAATRTTHVDPSDVFDGSVQRVPPPPSSAIKELARTLSAKQAADAKNIEKDDPKSPRGRSESAELKRLRARVIELEHVAKTPPKRAPASAPDLNEARRIAYDAGRKHGHDEGYAEGHSAAVEAIRPEIQALRRDVEALTEVLAKPDGPKRVLAMLEKRLTSSAKTPRRAAPPPAPSTARSTGTQRQKKPSGAVDPNSEVGRGKLRNLLIAMAQHPQGIDAVPLGIIAEAVSTGSTFRTYIGKIIANGWGRREGKRFFATEQGIRALGSYEKLPTGKDLAKYWIGRIGGGAIQTLLESVIAAGKRGISRADWQASIHPSSPSTFRTYAGKIKALQLITGNDPVFVAPALLG
jgi:hypothetical protein